MDNLFEILIYLIIIISFLSSVFKKKQQQQKQPPKQPQSDDYYQAEVAESETQEKVEYDILKELEDFFKVGTEPTKKEIPIPQEASEKYTKSEEQTRREIWQERTKSEHLVEDWELKKAEVKKSMARVDSGIEKQAARFEELLVKKETALSSIALSVKSKITNPSTLKEYIIFSEILGKPKALRR